MTKLVRATLLSLIAVVLAVVPAFSQETAKIEKFAGVYEFEAPDYGVISISVELTEEGGLALTAMNATNALEHLSGNMYEMDSAEFGIINIGFVEENGAVTSMTIDSYDFSFVAAKID